MNEKLKPCPFCGSDDPLFSYPMQENERWHFKEAIIDCSNPECGARMYILTKGESNEATKDLIIKQWNTRPAFDVEEIVEAVMPITKKTIDYWYNGETPNNERVEYMLAIKNRITTALTLLNQKR